MLKQVNVQRGFDSTSVVFEVPLGEGHASVYMRAVIKHGMHNRRALVFVDAQKFHACWRAEFYGIHDEQAQGSRTTWPLDRKFPEANRGFAQGISNPVPLAYVHARSEPKRFPITKRVLGIFKRTIGYETRPVNYVTFTDGVTRTIWLLNFGAPVFPVMVDQTEAAAMHAFCGVGDGPVSFTQLLTRHAA